MEKTIELKWDIISVTPLRVMYYVNDREAGENDAGFDLALNAIKEQPDAAITVKVTVINGLGGESLEDSLPFKDRISDLFSAAGKRNIAFTI